MQNISGKETAVRDTPHVIAITSGKGGVGKSSITVNLGITLAKQHHKVCLLDADTGLANVNILLGLKPDFSLEHVLYGAKSLDQVMLQGPHGLSIIPGANGISECVDLHPRQQLRLTRELADIEQDFDYLLIDTAAGISSTTLDFVSASHHTLIVITPEPTSLTDAFSLIKLLKRRNGQQRYQVVVNMCTSVAQARELYRRFQAAVAKYIGIQMHFLGYLLRDESMHSAVVLQNPVAMFADTDPSARSFIKLADALHQACAEAPGATSFSTYWHQQFRLQALQDADAKGGATAQEGSITREDGAAEQGTANEVPTSEVPGPDLDNVLKANAEVAGSEQSPLPATDTLDTLHARLLLLIEQEQIDEQPIMDMLQESVAAFTKRFERCPVDLAQLIEHLIQMPERNDQLLREAADRLRPWAGHSSQTMLNDMGALDEISGLDAASIETNELPLNNAWVVDDSSAPAGDEARTDETEINETGIDNPDVEASDQPDSTAVSSDYYKTENGSTGQVVHHYDRERFGSQESLLDLLQRKESSRQTVADFLASLAPETC